jgi:hypothetical protein
LRIRLEFEGPGTTPAFAARAASAIEAAWKGNASRVAVATHVDARVRTDSQAPSDGALDVYVPAGRGSPYTRRAGDLGSIPTTWPERLGSAEIAHETGHLLGFADEYHVEVRGGFYYVVYDDPERLMSSPSGRVSRGDLDALVDTYRNPCPSP